MWRWRLLGDKIVCLFSTLHGTEIHLSPFFQVSFSRRQREYEGVCLRYRAGSQFLSLCACVCVCICVLALLEIAKVAGHDRKIIRLLIVAYIRTRHFRKRKVCLLYYVGEKQHRIAHHFCRRRRRRNILIWIFFFLKKRDDTQTETKKKREKDSLLVEGNRWWWLAGLCLVATSRQQRAPHRDVRSPPHQ